MPTYDALDRFWADYAQLGLERKRQFIVAKHQLVAAIGARSSFPRSLRVKRMQGHPGVWEMTWAPDGRATFEYGDEVLPGQAHITWRRIGSHDIFRNP